MKTAKWEPSTGALAAWLATRPRTAWFADLYTLTLVGSGPVLQYTTSDIDITIPYSPTPLVYDSKTALFDSFDSKASAHWKVGLDVDTWQVVVGPRSTAMIGSQSWLTAVRGGALSGALVSVDRAFYSAPPANGSASLMGVANIFTGRVAEVDFGRSAAVVTINSHLELLGVGMPLTLYQQTCRWNLFSSGCGLVAASYGVSGTLASGSSQSTLLSAVAAPAGSGTYALGRISFTSGANAGVARSVRSWTKGSPGSLVLLKPLPFAVTPGDAFTAWPGCDGGEATCGAFGNTANFGGCPWIPSPETAT